MEQLEMHSAVRNVMRLFDRIRDYESRARARRGELSRDDLDALVDALVLLARVLFPFAPHMAEELLLASGQGDAGRDPTWPELSPVARVRDRGAR
jgi:leucyl-tRNA synthetase